MASESSPCHHYEKTLDGVLNPLLAARYFVEERSEKLRGVWGIVEAKRMHGVEPTDALPDTPGERIVGPAKELLKKLDESFANFRQVEDKLWTNVQQ